MHSQSIWRAAHKVAADEMPRLKSGICEQPGLASTLAHFAIDQSNQASETIDALVAALEAARPWLPFGAVGPELEAVHAKIEAALALARKGVSEMDEIERLKQGGENG